MRTIIFLMQLIAFPFLSMAQSYMVTGKIMDNKTVPIEFANVILYTLPDSTFCCGGITQKDGSFKIEIPAKQKYLLKISTMGFNDKTLELNIDKDIFDTGEIIIDSASIFLSEVVITARRPTFQYIDNALIMNVANSSISDLGDANDIIKRMPGVIVSGENFNVFGKGVPEIYINHKKVRNQSELSLLNSSDIASVELISNPGAAYDASTRAVLIIRTKKKQDNNQLFSAQFRERLLQGYRFSHTDNLSINFQNKGFSSYLDVYNANTKLKTKEITNTVIHTDTLFDERGQNDYKKNFNNLNLQAGIDYSLNENHGFGVQYIFGSNCDNVISTIKDNVLANDIDYTTMNADYDIDNKGINHSVNLFYIGQLNKRINLKVDLDYLYNKINGNQYSIEQTNLGNRDFDILSHSIFNIYAGKMVLGYALPQNNNLAIGIDYSRVTGSGDLFDDKDYIEETEYKNGEDKKAAFFEYSYRGKIELNAGIRFEHMKSSYKDNFIINNFEKIYNQWFPSISIGLPIKNAMMGLSFSSRVQRPSFRQLNNTMFYSRFHYEMGNPQLQPEKINDLNYLLKWKFLTFQLNYQYIKDYIALNIYSDSLVSYITIGKPVNFPKYQQLMSQLTGELGVGSLNSTITAAFVKPSFTNIYLGNEIKINKPYGMFSIQNVLKLQSNLTAYVDFQYLTSGTYQIYTVSPSNSLDIGLSKSFFNKSLIVTLWGMNLLNGQNVKVDFNSSNVHFHKQSFDDTRQLRLIITCKINNVKKKYRGESSAEDEKNRL